MRDEGSYRLGLWDTCCGRRGCPGHSPFPWSKWHPKEVTLWHWGAGPKVPNAGCGWAGDLQGGARLPGLGRALSAVRQCQAESHQTSCCPVPLSSCPLQILMFHFFLDFISKVSVAPWLVFKPTGGHLSLQHYQSGVKFPLSKYGVLLTHSGTHGPVLLIAVFPGFLPWVGYADFNGNEITPPWNSAWNLSKKQNKCWNENLIYGSVSEIFSQWSF